MTVTVVLDKASYLSGDTATATAVVYRTPGPGNYTYAWEVRNFFFQLLAQEPNGNATYRYAIPLDYTGTLRFSVAVDDGTATAVGARNANVAIAYMSLTLDRGEYNPGDAITASYGVSSRVITRPTYDYDVTDQEGTTVLQGTTNSTFFTFRTPNPSSRSYTFHVTATEDANSTEASATIAQASGAVLSVTLDRPSYAPGETVRIHLALTPKGTTALPSQFRWLAIFAGSTVSSTTTLPQADLSFSVPQGASGDLLVIAQESNTGSIAYQTVHVGPSNAFWTTEIGGVPAFVVLLALLVLLVLVGLVAVWRRLGGGLRPPQGAIGGPTPPPPPPGPTRAPPTSPMTAMCRNCGKPIDLTTSKRPIEVMCPSCGETQLVT